MSSSGVACSSAGLVCFRLVGEAPFCLQYEEQ